MAAAVSSRRAAAQQPRRADWAPAVVVLAVVAAVAAQLWQLPGGLVALWGVAAAGWFTVPPELTGVGSRSAGGAPVPGTPAEEKKLARHRFFLAVRRSAVWPTVDWWPGDIAGLQEKTASPDWAQAASWRRALTAARLLLVPSRLSAVAAVGVGLIVVTLPVARLDVLGWWPGPGSGFWLMWPNGAAAAVCVMVVAAARRHTAAPSDPRPPVTMSDLTAICTGRGTDWRREAVTAAVAAVVAAAATLTAVYAAGVGWLVVPPAAAAAGAGLACGAWLMHARLMPEAVEAWKAKVAARALWDDRWPVLKLDPAPWLADHRDLYADPHDRSAVPVTADTFEAPASLGASGAVALTSKIGPVAGAGVRVSVLFEEDTGQDHQPIPGSKHPLRFTVVCWPVSVTVDAADPDVNVDLLRLGLRCGAAAAATETGQPPLMLTGLDPIWVRDDDTAPAGVQVDVDDGPYDDDGRDDDGPAPAGPSTAAWATTWAATDAAVGSVFPAAAGVVAGAVGTGEGIFDPSTGTLFVGALTTGTTRFQDEGMADLFDGIARTDAWTARWAAVLKMGEVQPFIQLPVYRQVTLPGGQRIFSQPFMTSQGVDGASYMTAEREQKLKSTLAGAPFVSVAGWFARGDRSGSRHPGAFAVQWSAQPVPTSPARLTPDTAGGGPAGRLPRRGRPRTGGPSDRLGRPVPVSGSDRTGVRFVLQAIVNAGFDAAKLTRPELVEARALTVPGSPEHVWDVTVRLYGGVTLLDVKKQAEKIRAGMGACPWLRVTGHPEGARIVAGGNPHSDRVVFTGGDAREVTVALDWEQAFVDAKLSSPVDGQAPLLVHAGVLPDNDQVQDLLFTLPRGLALGDFQEPKNKARMMAASGNEFIDVRQDADPRRFRLLACPTDPMPNPATPMWGAVGRRRVLPFGTNVEGAPVLWSLDTDPHLLILGGSGSGKTVAASSILAAQLAAGWDLYAADPSKGFMDFTFADPWLRVRATSYEDTAAVVRGMLALLDERKELCARYGVGDVGDLPEEVRPAMACLYIDEFTSLVLPGPVVKPGDRAGEQELREYQAAQAVNDAKRMIGAGVGRILREGRATGLVLVLMAQKLAADTLKSMPGGSVLKSQMSRLAMGKMSFNDMMSAFSDAAAAADVLGASVPRGRGVFESTAQAPFAVQTWWMGGTGSKADHFAALAAHLRTIRDPLRDADRFDPEPFRPAAPDDVQVFGARLDTPEGAPDDEYTVVDRGVLGGVDLSGFDFASLPHADDTTPDADDDGPADGGELAPDGGAADTVRSDADDRPAAGADADAAGDVAEVAVEGQPAPDVVVFCGPGVGDDPQDMPEDATVVDVDRLPAGPAVSGSAAVDAIAAWVAGRGRVPSRVVWLSPLADVRDDIGVTHGALAVDVLTTAGVVAVECRTPAAADVTAEDAGPGRVVAPTAPVADPSEAPAAAGAPGAPDPFRPAVPDVDPFGAAVPGADPFVPAATPAALPADPFA